MIRAEQIPPEVVEAAARALAIAENRNSDEWWPFYMRRARASIVAALNAWPMVNLDAVRCGTIILPLPQEISDE